MKVKIKKLHKDAEIPNYSKPGDAGMDLTAISVREEVGHITYYTGLAMEIPVGYVGLLFPRSSVYKTGQTLANSVGVIDSGYRGEIMLKFKNGFGSYNVGDRVGQIIILPYPEIQFEEVETLSLTDRSKGGFGSTGN
tara:strand:+ start:2365 stop:2775 length:411 start_codon:yes stop_codon:yes gene_type:complete